jgi:hypothetical protein
LGGLALLVHIHVHENSYSNTIYEPKAFFEIFNTEFCKSWTPRILTATLHLKLGKIYVESCKKVSNKFNNAIKIAKINQTFQQQP